MLQIKSVTIEGMHNVTHKTYDFTTVNYLHGLNGAGKSTVLQAIQLALLGYVPGMNKTKESILSNSNSHTMAVTLAITGGTEPISIQRIFTQTKKGTTTTVNIEPDGFEITDILSEMELPVFNFKEFTGMTSNKLKDWFINFLPSGEGKLDWDKLLKEEVKLSGTDQTSNIKEASETFNKWADLKAVDRVREANAYFKDKISICKTEINRLDSTIKSLLFYDDVDSLESVDELNAKVKALQDTKVSVLANNNAINLYNSVNAELAALNFDESKLTRIDELKAQIDEAAESRAQFEAKQDKVTADDNLIIQEIAELKAKISNLNQIIATGGVCSYTNEKCPSIVQTIEDLKNDVATYTEEVNKLSFDHQTNAVKIKELKEQIYECASATIKCTNEINGITRDKASYDRLKAQIANFNIGSLVYTDISEIDKQIGEYTSKVTKLLANERFSEMSETLAKEKYQFEIDLAAYKAWEKLTSVNGLQTAVSNEPFVKLAQDIDKFIRPLFGDNVCADFNLEARANSFSFGITRDEHYIQYDLLSSGEKCMFTLAMMITLISQSKDTLKVIMIDDLFDNLDDSNANKIIQAITDIKDIQFIVAGVKDIKAVKPEQLIEVKYDA